jgi:hypothetical protein
MAILPCWRLIPTDAPVGAALRSSLRQLGRAILVLRMPGGHAAYSHTAVARFAHRRDRCLAAIEMTSEKDMPILSTAAAVIVPAHSTHQVRKCFDSLSPCAW